MLHSPKASSLGLCVSLRIHPFCPEHIIVLCDNSLSLFSETLLILDPHQFTILHLLSNSRLCIVWVLTILLMLLLNGLQLIIHSI